MKAAILYAAGPPDSFSIEETDVPEVGVNDVLIQVVNCGVSYRDVSERSGLYKRDVTYPLIMGLEISGRIVAKGAGVPDGFEIGDHVCTKAFSSCGNCSLCRNGRETTCSLRKPVRGGYGEFTALPWDSVVVVSEGIPFEVSCSLGPAAGVALNAVRDVAQVRIGESVLVTGATGGVGWPAMQIAKASGARVIALTRSEAKVAQLKAGGADHVVVSSDDSFAEKVRDLTKGNGVDVVIDNVGTPVFGGAFSSLARHGRMALIGQLSPGNAELSLARIFFKRAQILGVGSVSRSQLQDTISLVAEGKIKPHVAQSIPLTEVGSAHAMLEAGEVVGRVVIAHGK